MRLNRFLIAVLLLNIPAVALCSPPEANNRKRIESCFNELDNKGFILHNFDSASYYLLKIISLSETSGTWDLCLKALSELAYISDQNYRHQMQKEATEKGIHILKSETIMLDSLDPGYVVRGDMQTMIGLYYRNNGEFSKAIDVFQSLIQTLRARKTADKKSVFNAYAYIADLYMKMGLYEKVYEYYILAEKSIPEEKDEKFYYSYLHRLYLGSYFYRIKDYNKAKSYYTAALKQITGKKPDGNWIRYFISNYNILAIIYQELGLRDSAVIFLNKSLALQHPDDPGIIRTYEYYGDCLFSFNEFDTALEYYQKTYNGLDNDRYFNAYKKAQLLLKIGNSRQNLKQYTEAIHNYQLAFSILFKDESYIQDIDKNPAFSIIQADKTVIRLLLSKAETLFEQAENNTEKEKLLLHSLSAFRLASIVTDAFRHNISTDDFKEFFVTDIRDMYNDAVKASYAAYTLTGNDSIIEWAFYFMEKSKNQVLLDAIKAYNARNYSDIPDSLMDKESLYKNRLVELQNKLYKLKFADQDQQLIKNCQYEYTETQTAYNAFLKELERTYPNYYSLKYKNEIPAFKDVQQLNRNSIVIEYLVGNDYISLIALNRKKAVFKLVAVDSQFYNTLNGFLHNLTSMNFEEKSADPETFDGFISQSVSLYSLLLEPALQEFEKTGKIVIIPDDKLCFLPFELLINKPPENLQVVDYKNLDYAIRHYPFRYEFSTELLVDDRNLQHKAKNKNVYLGFAPVYRHGDDMAEINALGRNKIEFLTPLKYNSREIKDASSIFNGMAYYGVDANEKTFMKYASAFTIIHIAAHTIINDSIPELSGIFFTPLSGDVDDHAGTEDNAIYINEIFSMNLNSSLVILSACETGKGKLLKGEGLISIGRAFKYAGCPSLIMSLWKINDRSASEIISSFCSNLKKGNSKDVALRKAKLSYLRKAGNLGNTHPFYWSAFVVIGNNEPLFSRPAKKLIWPGCGFLLIALFLFFRFVRK